MWLVGLVAGMVILSGAAAALLVVNHGRRSSRATVLEKSLDALRRESQYYNPAAAKALDEATAFRQKQLNEIVTHLRQDSQWEPLIPGIFPAYRTRTQVYNFKLQYPGKLKEFMARLGAADPNDETRSPLEMPMMHANPVTSFYTADWISKTELALTREALMKQLRHSQDDLWLQEDIVAAIKRTNDLYFETLAIPEEKRTIQKAVVKELQRVTIGVQRGDGSSYSPYGGSSRRGQRYLYAGEQQSDDFAMGGTAQPAQPAEAETDKLAMTLTGRASDNNQGRYWVLPFSVTVTADAGNAMELVRQLTGTRSFITIVNVRYEIIPETENAYRSMGMMMPKLDTRTVVYGNRPLARLTLWGESLIFHVEGARPTVPPKPKTEGGAV
jgi:hypothetical protein